MNKALKVIPNKIDKSITLVPEKSYFSVIWLHGLGDSPAGFFQYFQDPSSPVYKGARVKLLHAPLRPVSVNGGSVCPSWYDIKNFSFKATDEEAFSIKEINESLSILDENVKQQIEYWKQMTKQTNEETICKRIFVGGFSQGCAMSLLYGLTAKYLLGGVIGFSGHMFRSFQFINKDKIPILAYHGKDDSVIDYRVAKLAYQNCFGKQSNFTFKLISGLPHTVTQQQLQQATNWMLQILKQNKIDH